MALKKRDFTPESGTVDTYDIGKCELEMKMRSMEGSWND